MTTPPVSSVPDSSAPPHVAESISRSNSGLPVDLVSPAPVNLVSPAPDPSNRQAHGAVVAGRGLAGAALLVMVLFVLSRATGLLREVIIGNQFGTSAELDAYLAAFRVPDILFQLVAGGALGSAFIPTFAQYWVKDDRRGAWQLFSRTLNLLTLILVVLAGLAALGALPLVSWIIAPGFSPEQQQLTASLMRGMLISTVIFGASGLIMGALNALQHFLFPAFAPVLYNVAIILGSWLLGPRWGVYGLVVGAVVGAIAHLLVQLPALVQQRASYTLELSVQDPGVREVMRLMGPRILGLLFVQLHFLVNTILASGLEPGSLSALNYAWLLMLLPLGVFAQAIGTVIFPTFAAQVAAGEHEAMRSSFSLILRLVIFLTLPAAAGLWVLDYAVVRLLFEHGEFGPRSTELVVFALHFYAIGLISHAIVEIGVRVFYALHDTWTPVLVGVGAMALNVLLSLLWVGMLRHGGLALANTVATTLEMLLLLILLHKRLGGMEVGALATSLIRSALAAGIMALVVWAMLRWFASLSGLGVIAGEWLPALGGVVVAVATYGVTSLVVGSTEARWLINVARRRMHTQR
jgi:putative peptidoglycan lipid II flippase